MKHSKDNDSIFDSNDKFASNNEDKDIILSQEEIDELTKEFNGKKNINEDKEI